MPSNNFLESSVYRIYKCDNCEGIIGLKQKVKDKWKKKCPICSKYKLFIQSGSLKLELMIDHTIPKTLGSLAEKNRDKRLKEGKDTKGFKDTHSPTPLWRDNKKINYDILKNPAKYIEKGSV